MSVAIETYKVFFRKVALRVIVSTNDRVAELEDENEELKRQLKKVKENANEIVTCPLCKLPISSNIEEPSYCTICNVGLPCQTWKDEEHEQDAIREHCLECEEYCCSDCFNLETDMCERCNDRHFNSL